MNTQRAHKLPWYAWLILDLAGLFVVAYALSVDKVTGREALGAVSTITTCGFLAHLFQRKKGGGFTPPPSGVACLVLLLPLALAALGSLDRRA